MRHADDLADDESLPRLERRRRLDEWLANWRGVCHGGDTLDLVFLAGAMPSNATIFPSTCSMI